MADRKLSASTALTSPDDLDLAMIVDVSDTTDAASGTNKKITWANIKTAIKTYYDAATSTFTNKTFDANGTGNSITNLETADFAANVVDTDTALAANSDTRIPSQKAAKAYVDSLSSVYQPVDSDLTSIAGLTPTNDDIIQRKAGAWTNRTMAQLKTDLALTKSDVGLGNVTDDAQIPASIMDAKGDIIAASADNTPAKVAVGSNGQVLTADSTEASGVKWATPAAGSVTVEDENLIIGMRFFGF